MRQAIGSEIESTPAKAYDLGRIGLPLDQRPGITLPTPANLQAVADNAAAKRAQESHVQSSSPDHLGRSWGVSRDMVLFLQRLEGKVIELENEVQTLRRTAALPPHMRAVEVR
jgi:hypothetical protein